MKKRNAIRIIWKILIFSFSFIFLVLFSFYLYAYITPKMDLKNSNIIIMYDNENNKFYDTSTNSSWTSLDDISDFVINGMIATEDKNFYNHNGFDFLRIIKALYTDIKNNSLTEGASTISQQYIKNLFLTFDKTWSRKIEEAYLTFELEAHYSKDEIMEGYLNTINFGGGNYGIENASLYYFNKKSADLTLAEASIIVGIPKNPTYYNPINYYDNAKSRQYIVLNSMYENGYITKNEFDEAYKAELNFYGVKDSNAVVSSLYYKDAVINELNNIDSIPKSLIKTGGIKVYTYLDNDIQKNIENIVSEEMKDSELEVGVLVRNPKNGAIQALLGGKNYYKSEYNRVVTAKRQVGSAIKPILYYAALENGMTSASTFSSEKTTFNIGANSTYSPTNYGDNYANKEITLAEAISLSDNIFAVKTHLFLGTETLKETAKRMGINKELSNNASLALGTDEMTLLDFSNAYSTLANYGTKTDSTFISKVTDLKGNIIYEHKYYGEEVLDKRYVFILNNLLSNTYNYNYIDYASPTLLSIKGLLTKKYAVKSGTTDTDFIVAGYNPDSLVIVWNGYDDNQKLSGLNSSMTKNIWAKCIEAATSENESSWYEIPEGISGEFINHITGSTVDLSSKDLLYFIKGTEP